MVIDLCPFSEDSEHEKMFSTYLRQKKVSRVMWMNEPVRNVDSISCGIDGMNVFKVKGKNRL